MKKKFFFNSQDKVQNVNLLDLLKLLNETSKKTTTKICIPGKIGIKQKINNFTSLDFANIYTHDLTFY